MSVETSLPWPSNIPELKRLDELLRCGICYEFMSTSMVTVCSHNYCSLCIRQYLGYKTQCPACFQETTCQQLRNNRLLDEIIALFPDLRDKIARRCQSAKGNSISGYLINKEVENGEVIETDAEDLGSKASTPNVMLSPDLRGKTSVFSPRSNTKVLPPAETPTRNIGKQSPLNVRSPQVVSTPSRLVGGNTSNVPSRSPAVGKSPISSGPAGSSTSLTQSGRQAVSGFFSILTDRGGTNSNSCQDGPKVSCPVCNVSIPERNINFHLDACLQRMEAVEKGEIICIDKLPKRKPLPKLVYSLLSDKQLRQKLKDIGLSVQGEKQALTNRHRRYTILYNAECDVADPRPIPELLRQVEREEKEEAKGTTTKSIFNYDRKTDPEIIEKEQVNYIKKNDKHFASLIADVKRRQAEAKKKKEMKTGQTEEHISAVLPGTSKTVTKQMSNRASVNRHMLSSDEDSDAETNNNKLENNVVDKPKSILNFFKSSPMKSSQRGERSCHADNYREPIVVDLAEEKCKASGNSSHHNNENTCTSPRRDHSVISTQSTVEVEKETLPSSSMERCNQSNDPHSQRRTEDEDVNPSPDFFAASPASSGSSGASMSLLHDQELDSSHPSETFSTGNEARTSSDAVSKYQPELSSRHDEGSSKPTSDSEDDEMIPAHQPESCPLEEAEFERPPSPSIGRRVTRSKTPSSQSKQQDLSCLGPETQSLEFDSQIDPDYEPSQILQEMDIEENCFEAAKKTRRSSRKRQAPETAAKVARNVRKKK